MKPNMLKNGVSPCSWLPEPPASLDVIPTRGQEKTLKRQLRAYDTENFDTGPTARSLSLVQADVSQSMGDVISPISGALHVLDGFYDTVNQNWTDHQNGGSASLLANEGDRLNLVYNAIRDRFDGIYDNTGAAGSTY